ncbi:17348_t:CDS:2, partial [Entrophospora sp. SA101]
EDVLASKLDDTGETKQVNTFVPKEQSSANISDTVNASLVMAGVTGKTIPPMGNW